MIISAEEVNSILQISGMDDAINGIIPFAELNAIDYIKNSFHLRDQYVEGYQISFSSADKKITNLEQSFINNSYYCPIRFQAGLFIHVQNSIFNDGFFKIASVNNNILTVSSSDTLYDEEKGSYIRIDLVKFPNGFKLSLARYIGFLLEGNKGQYKSESIGDYSYTRKDGDKMLAEFFYGYRNVGVV